MRLTEDERWHWLAVAEELALVALDRMRGPRPERVDTKADPADLVTEVDREIERLVLDRLASLPGHRVIGEEYGATPGDPDDLVWYVDPVDGTTNYAHDLGWSSFSLALADADGLAVGVVGNPYRGELFGAARGLGARRDGVPIRCSDAASLAGQVVLTELSGHRPWPGFAELLDELAARHATMRVMGSTALSLVSTAAGRSAATILGDFHTLDGAAAVLIAREAGAVVCDARGVDSPLPADGRLFVATPAVLGQVSSFWTFVDS